MPFVYIQLNDKTVLFQTTQFSMPFVFTKFKCQTVLFDSKIGPYRLLPLGVRVDPIAKAMKMYFALPKAPVLLEPQPQIIL